MPVIHATRFRSGRTVICIPILGQSCSARSSAPLGNPHVLSLGEMTWQLQSIVSAHAIQKRVSSLYYGWRMIGLVSAIRVLGGGLHQYGFTVFFLPVTQDLGMGGQEPFCYPLFCRRASYVRSAFAVKLVVN